jgi:pSer/pThr/pTyr-binding forkhead associated (FHA) protein
MLIPILVVAIVAVLGFIGYLAVTSQSQKNGSGTSGTAPSKPQPKTSSKPAAKAPVTVDDDEDEATQVRVVGPRLVRIMGGLKVGDEIPISGGVTIGRGQGCTLSLHDAEMSSKHAEVKVEAGVSVLVDLGSTNGSFLNDRQVSAHVSNPLKDGDRIRLGMTQFLFRDPK